MLKRYRRWREERDQLAIAIDHNVQTDPGLKQQVITEAAAALQANDRTIQQILSESSSLYKWLLASLLTLNAGAIVSLASAFKDMNGIKLAEPITFFVFGAVAAISTGVITALSYLVQGCLTGKSIAQWREVNRTALGFIAAVRFQQKQFYIALATSALTILTGIASMACFVKGALGIAAQFS